MQRDYLIGPHRFKLNRQNQPHYTDKHTPLPGFDAPVQRTVRQRSVRSEVASELVVGIAGSMETALRAAIENQAIVLNPGHAMAHEMLKRLVVGSGGAIDGSGWGIGSA